MKFVKLFFLSFLMVLIASCNTDKVIMPNPAANVLFNIQNTVKGQPILQSTSVFTNAAGNNYSIDLLKYYISNITLVDDKGLSTNYKNYNLIDAFDVNSLSFLLDKKIPNGNYRKLIFYMGVDQERNHTGAQEGALSASNGMIWTWTFGYIFYKLEGHFTTSSITTQTPYRNHLGLDSALSTIEIPILMEIKGNDKKVNLNFDVDKIMGDAVSGIDLAIDNDRQSGASDGPWMKKAKTNASKAFTVTSIE